jgi:uncharacterized protein (DUF952 family)
MLLHITSNAEWAVARDGDRYEAPSLSDEGFIHCSTPEQIVATANRFYARRQDLVVLVVDPERLSAEVRFENTVGGEELFPHVYGAIDVMAVIRVHRWIPVPGEFSAPAWLEGL